MRGPQPKQITNENKNQCAASTSGCVRRRQSTPHTPTGILSCSPVSEDDQDHRPPREPQDHRSRRPVRREFTRASSRGAEILDSTPW